MPALLYPGFYLVSQETKWWLQQRVGGRREAFYLISAALLPLQISIAIGLC
jgi:hypothetical protein